MKMGHYHFEELTSTNDFAKEKIKSFDKESLTVITADKQSAGRGSWGRKWISPQVGNLYGTFCFFVKKECQELHLLTYLMAISVISLLEKKGLSVQMKYPNDLTVKGKKIGGILCESVPFDAHLGIVLGIGLNVNMRKEELNEIGQPATSLYRETNLEHDVKEVTDLLKEEFAKNLGLYLRLGFAPFSSLLRELWFTGPTITAS